MRIPHIYGKDPALGKVTGSKKVIDFFFRIFQKLNFVILNASNLNIMQEQRFLVLTSFTLMVSSVFESRVREEERSHVRMTTTIGEKCSVRVKNEFAIKYNLIIKKCTAAYLCRYVNTSVMRYCEKSTSSTHSKPRREMFWQ